MFVRALTFLFKTSTVFYAKTQKLWQNIYLLRRKNIHNSNIYALKYFTDSPGDWQLSERTSVVFNGERRQLPPPHISQRTRIKTGKCQFSFHVLQKSYEGYSKIMNIPIPLKGMEQHTRKRKKTACWQHFESMLTCQCGLGTKPKNDGTLLQRKLK